MVRSTWTWTQGLAIAGVLASSMFAGTSAMAQEEAPAVNAGIDLFNLPADFGWLSDPKTPAEDIGDALFGGKFSLNNRLRWEYVDQTGKDTTNAITNRTRIGYSTKALGGLSLYAEMENNTPFDRSDYSVPQASQGNAAKAVVADPEEVELNQAYVKYTNNDNWKLNLIVGRQRIILDDSRFVGNVGWRQMEQTFDAVLFNTDFGIENLDFTYIYIWQVNRIFTEEATVAGARPLDSETHLINGSYQFCDALKLTGFAYLFDLENDGGNGNSNATYGLTLSGKVQIDDTWSVVYSGTYAHQEDYADNTTDYAAEFIGLDAKVVVKELGFAGAGYQLLGSDDGTVAFQFPAGTNHKFNGWADVFLGTPAAGLEDIYVYVGTTLPWGIKGKIIYHDFSADQGSGDLGTEWDAILVKNFNKNWNVLAKFADYDGENSSNADRTKFWLETTFKF